MTTLEQAAPLMRYRKRRIAWSLGWGIVAVLLCVLWGRSFQHVDILYGETFVTGPFAAQSLHGRIAFNRRVSRQPWGLSTHTVSSWEARQQTLTDFDASIRLPRQIKLMKRPAATTLSHCIVVLAVISLAIVPWLLSRFWRFSLRTLLLAVTLGSVLLGLIAWAVRG